MPPLPALLRSCLLSLMCGILAGPAVRAQAPTPTPQTQPTAPSAESPVARFDVFEYRVLGNTVLAQERIERAVYPFLGEKRSVDDVERARQALENAYREAGFGTVMVDTPEQRVNAGVVTLQVVQAPVSRLRVVGAKHFSQGRILDKVPALAEGQVPNFKDVGTQLGSVNRSADRRVTPLLRPGKTPGTTEVDLQVDDESPLHGSLELNNKHGANTTASRLIGALRYDNLWQREHSLGVQVQLSPQKTSEVKVVSLSYTVPVHEGLWVLSAVRSRSETLVQTTGGQVVGSGRIFGARRMFISGTEARSQVFTLGADYKNMDGNANADISCDEAVNVCTPVRYVPLSATYTTTLNDKQGAWQAGGGVALSLRGLVSQESQFANKRYGGQTNFSVLKFDLSRRHKLPRDMEFFGKLEGQVGSQPLISDEQFIAGGADSVRGYLESTAVGDKGLRVSFELRTPRLLGEKDAWLSDLRAHAFVEGAGLWLKSPLPGQDAREGLIGTGLGLRLRAGSHATLSLDLGYPLHDAGTTRRGTTRLHATGALEF